MIKRIIQITIACDRFGFFNSEIIFIRIYFFALFKIFPSRGKVRKTLDERRVGSNPPLFFSPEADSFRDVDF